MQTSQRVWEDCLRFAVLFLAAVVLADLMA